MFRHFILILCLFSVTLSRLYEEPVHAHCYFNMGRGIICGITKDFYNMYNDSAKAEEYATEILSYYQKTSRSLKWKKIILDLQIDSISQIEDKINVRGKDSTISTVKMNYRIGMYVIDPIVDNVAMKYENQKQEILFDYSKYIGSFAILTLTSMLGEEISQGYLIGRSCQIDSLVNNKIKSEDAITHAYFLSLAKNINVQGLFCICDTLWTPLYKADAVQQKVIDFKNYLKNNLDFSK